MLAAAAHSANIAQFFETIISVDDIRVFKPSPRVYDLASSRLQIDPRQTAFVSSNSWDVQGAGAAGLRAFWIQRASAEPPEELGYSPAGVVTSLTELSALVANRPSRFPR
jgi:2-haloacid dehalogenase